MIIKDKYALKSRVFHWTLFLKLGSESIKVSCHDLVVVIESVDLMFVILKNILRVGSSSDFESRIYVSL